jgi:predicted dehydrogenase
MLSLDFLSGRFGDPNLSGPSVDLPGGVVHDFLPHLAYLFLHFAGAPVDLVVGRLRNASGSPRVGFDELDALVVAGEVRGRLRIACDLSPDAFRLTVRGTEASIETDLYHPYQRTEGGANVGRRIALEHVRSGVSLAWSGVQNLRDKVLGFGVYHGLHRMLDAFYAALRDDRPQPIPSDAMLGSARLIDRLLALRRPA